MSAFFRRAEFRYLILRLLLNRPPRAKSVVRIVKARP